MRFLFEAGPEYFAKQEWVRDWNRLFPSIGPCLRSGENLGWFQDEHEDFPGKQLKTMGLPELKRLAAELTRRKDGQFVVGRSVHASDFVKLSGASSRGLALATFTPLAKLLEIHKAGFSRHEPTHRLEIEENAGYID